MKFQAIITKSGRREFTCFHPDQGEFMATAKGLLLKGESHLVVGDEVIISRDDSLNIFYIEDLIERKNLIFRRIIRENKIKPVASNLDLLVIVKTVSRPEFKRGMLDRYLMRAFQWEIPTIIVFNKIDQDFQEDLDITFEAERLRDIGVQVYCMSAIDKNLKFKNFPNLSDLKEMLKNKTSIFLGQSGVGKSKLISTLSNKQIELRSEAIGKVGKGTHTTTWTEMLQFNDFNIIDSPGVRTLSIDDILLEELDELFPDLYPYFKECKFNDCQHQLKSKHCGFVKSNAPDTILTRLESYKRFKEEISSTPDWQKA